ncbi:putative alpha-amylase 2 isoform X2 [Apium graveolens]|uniref:putative alpha-amylase 2 isoform X2 n=2 Tax=Apium graveolens TaxID=4045 RepID=UPI003D7B7FAB
MSILHIFLLVPILSKFQVFLLHYSLLAVFFHFIALQEFDESLQQHPLASEVYMLVNYTAEVCFAFVFVVAIIRNGKEILLQAFNWESHKHDWWRNLDSKVSDIAKSGFTSAWLPPPSNFFAPEGYLPQNLYSPDSSYGSESMLKDLLHKMRQHKVRTMADIVINHRIRTTQGHGGRYSRYDGISLSWDEHAVTSCTGGLYKFSSELKEMLLV